GTRAKTEEPLVEQLKRAGEVFDAFGIPVLDVAGFEADDVIGTVAEQIGGREDLETVILTGDMDMLQLIQDGRVTVYRLLTGISNMKYYDEDAVRERYGFGPEHVTDYKGMCGDPSDNIKGVRGIGEKTATELIQKFGSVEDIYKELKKDPEAFAKKGVKPRVVRLLDAGKESALFSKKLATIRRDAPIRFTLPDHPWRMRDHAEGMILMCDKLEFRSLRERIRALAHAASGAPEEHEAPAEDIAPDSLRETSVALWLLHSDITNPSLNDILHYAHAGVPAEASAQAGDFEKARAKIFAELGETGRLSEVYEKIEKPLIPVVERMNEAGILLDAAHLKELAREYGKEMGEIAGRIYKHAGREFNINSPKQMATVLYDELKIVPARHKMTAGGARTTRESELQKLLPAHPIVAEILAYRELQKLLSTYIEKMPAMVAEDGRLHAQFLQAGTTTGRMASQDPNLQNIPIKTAYGRRIREAFTVPRGSVLIALDYSQIELRIAAGLSGDRKLIDVFKEGGDVHVAVASQVFGVPPQEVDYEMRRRAKVINFGILYGMGVNALRANLGEDVSRDEAAAFLAEYFKKFSGLARYIKSTTQEAAKRGYTETLFGRRRYFPGLSSPLPQIRAQAERMAINAPIQGTQSDVIKLAMVEADLMIEKEGWRDDVRLVLQVHDELVYEAKKSVADAAAAKIRHAMETVVPAKALHGVPVIAEVSIGKNWGEMQRLSRI
ncbi:MAG: DNA polymerase, partial [Patescibacteria group bacterium]|nr:DNA polymerase [Patescibacteria group bacterium]